MSKIDTSQWGNFPIGSLFEIKKGTRLVKADMKDGNHPFVGASAINNGITARVANEEHLHKSNTITISYNGSVGEAFYQNCEFWASDDVNVLYPRFNMNKYIAMFLIPILKAVGKKYAFIDKWKKEDMERDNIKLPIDKAGNPDFSYMETYIKSLDIKVSEALTKLKSMKQFTDFSNVDISQWKQFKIYELFYTEKVGNKIQTPTGASVKRTELTVGEIPRITVTGLNNGIFGYFDSKCGNKNYRIYENFISVSFLGTVFYQAGKASLDMKVHCLKLVDKELDKYIGQYLVTCIKKSLKESRYSDQISSTILPLLEIRLPVDNAGDPNYEYMSNYMKSLESKVCDNIQHLSAV